MIRELVYFFSKNNPPAARAKSGDSLSFATLDCFSGKVRTESDRATEFGNPASGPVFIEGAEPGDILSVRIDSIKVAPQGVATTLPNVGPLADRMELRTKVLTAKNGETVFNGYTIKLRPMVGVIGVAPSGDDVPCGFPGSHGGNLDCKLMEEGAVIHLPVRVPGALFQLGDLHAVMGDGELCGTGLEVDGEVTVTFKLVKNRKIAWPVLETKDAWHVMACDLDYTKALTEAARQAQDLVGEAYGWDQTDAYLYLTLEGDVHVNQGCQPCPVPMVLRISMPKRDKPLLEPF